MTPTSAQARALSPARKPLSPLSSLIVFILIVAACGGGSEGESTAAPASGQTAASAAAAAAGSGETVVKMTGRTGSYEYDPDEMTFSVGQTVTFSLVGDDDTHTFTIEALDVDEFLEVNETRSFTVSFNTAGTYELTCIPHPEMTGTIIVQ